MFFLLNIYNENILRTKKDNDDNEKVFVLQEGINPLWVSHQILDTKIILEQF